MSGTQKKSALLNRFFVTFLSRFFPKHSMYGIFTCIYHENKPSVGKYTIHWVSGFWRPFHGYISDLRLRLMKRTRLEETGSLVYNFKIGISIFLFKISEKVAESYACCMKTTFFTSFWHGPTAVVTFNSSPLDDLGIVFVYFEPQHAPLDLNWNDVFWYQKQHFSHHLNKVNFEHVAVDLIGRAGDHTMCTVL